MSSSNSRRKLTLAAVALMSASALAFGALAWSETKQDFGKWGVDLTSRDLKVKPGDSFFNYASGSYLARTEIPADQSSTGAGRDVFNLTQEELRTLIESSASGASDPTAAQIGGMYKSFMDEAGIEATNAKPLMADLAAYDPEAALALVQRISRLVLQLLDGVFMSLQIERDQVSAQALVAEAADLAERELSLGVGRLPRA